jgi:hypothetical protein
MRTITIRVRSFRTRVCEESLQDVQKFGTDGLPLLPVVERQFLEKLFPGLGELDQDPPAIVGGPQTTQKTPIDEAVNKLDGAVMLQLHAFRQDAHRRFQVVRQPTHRQQELILLRLNAGLPRRRLAKAEKTANLVTQLGHRLKVREPGVLDHDISLYDTVALRYIMDSCACQMVIADAAKLTLALPALAICTGRLTRIAKS